jgi:uncharacterized protein with PIN domain
MTGKHEHVFNPADSQEEPICDICHKGCIDLVASLEQQLAQARAECTKAQNDLLFAERGQERLREDLTQARALLMKAASLEDMPVLEAMRFARILAAQAHTFLAQGGNDGKLWKATLRCAECGTVLNTAEHVPEEDKAGVAVFAPFAAGPCPHGCRSTFWDMNLNTTLEWSEQRSEV